jgi:hypothetical protein
MAIILNFLKKKMDKMGILLMAIGGYYINGYFINGYWWLFY